MHFTLFPQNFSLSNAPAARCWYLCWQCAENLHGTRCVTGWSISVLWTWVWWVLKTVRKTEAKMYHHCLRQTQQPKRIHTSRRSLSLCMLYTFGPSPMLGGWNLAKAAMLVKFLPTGQPHRYPAMGIKRSSLMLHPLMPSGSTLGVKLEPSKHVAGIG